MRRSSGVYTVKQHGALTAKGRLLGVQFDTLFSPLEEPKEQEEKIDYPENLLYFNISWHAALMAEQLKAILAQKGYPFLLDSPTNQIFVVLKNDKLSVLREHVRFSMWEKVDENHTAVRFATSWSTTPEQIRELAGCL